MALVKQWTYDERDILLNSEHKCPSADVSACEYCKLINLLISLVRTFQMKHDDAQVELIQSLLDNVCILRRLTDDLKPHLSRYDFDEGHHYNGYRSFVTLSRTAVTKCRYLVNEINNYSRFYSPKLYPIMHEKLVDWDNVFRVLKIVIESLVEFATDPDASDSLFTSNRKALDHLIALSTERNNIVGFHGRLVGFQFSKSVRSLLRIVSTLLAAFSEIYKKKSLFHYIGISPFDFWYYWTRPERRAERIAKICIDNPMSLFKSFWMTQEYGIVRIISKYLGESIDFNTEIAIPPAPINITTATGKEITVLPPTEYLGSKLVMARLLSNKIRRGAIGSQGKSWKDEEEPSPALIIHCHGGGFIAQSSNSQGVYLKSWTKGADVPLLSIDYSLSPEAPYPRALHEAFFAYVWAIQNAHLLGSTGEKIILAGDSAGGLLVTGVVILCIELGIRPPDGLFLAYAPLLLETAISPARLLSVADPMIPYPALAGCLEAYLGKNFDPKIAKLPGDFVDGPWEEDICGNESSLRSYATVKIEELHDVQVPVQDWHLSPLIAPDSILRKFPPTSIVTTVFDPCSDDCIEFAKRLRLAKIPVTLDVLSLLNHGFLNFSRASEDCNRGLQTCIRRLREFIETV